MSIFKQNEWLIENNLGELDFWPFTLEKLSIWRAYSCHDNVIPMFATERYGEIELIHFKL